VRNMRDALVGVVIVGALLITAFGTLWLQGETIRGDWREVEAVFREVGQIRPGNPVKLRGVRIGRVREVNVTPEGDAVRLELRIDANTQLPADAVVVLSPESMFGDWQAEIHSRNRFPHATYREPTRPGVLPGYALPDISQLTAAADRISENIEVLTDRVGIAFSEETARNIASLIGNVEDVTERLSDLISQQAASFTGVTDQVGSATEAIGDAAVQARSAFQRVDQLLGREEVGEVLEDLAVLTETLKSLTSDMRGTMADVGALAARADTAFASVNRITARAEAGEGAIGRLLEDPTAALEMEAAMSELTLLLEDIRMNPRRYLRLSIF
jgi:phospholipid/cholesterol/gamma-HCH transport system substrate-binding protein